MDSITFLRESYNELFERVQTSCQNMAQEALTWRPAPHSNHIAAILWHLIRAEDRVVSEVSPSIEQVWVSGGWYKKLGHPLEQANRSPAAIDWNSLPFPSLELLLGYYGEVHAKSLEYLETIEPADLDRALDPERPWRTVGALLRHSLIHTSNHHGQIDYLKGVLHPEWDLPPGTGIKQS